MTIIVKLTIIVFRNSHIDNCLFFGGVFYKQFLKISHCCKLIIMSFNSEFIIQLLVNVIYADYLERLYSPFINFLIRVSSFIDINLFSILFVLFIVKLFFQLKCLRQDYLWKKHFE